MRSCSGATAALAVVVMIVHERSGSTPSAPFGRQVAHRPAKANGSPSARVIHHGRLDPSRRCHS